MHSIERYGIVALLFLVVTVVAVLMWDGNKGKKKGVVPESAALAAGQALPATEQHPMTDDASRLNLVAESQPGPLQRHPRAGRAGFAQTNEPQALTSEPAALQDGALQDGAAFQEGVLPQDGAAIGTPTQPVLQSPLERPAPEEPVIGLNAGPSPLRTPASTGTHAYAVRAGDTLSEIAQRELGSSRRWQELVAANPGLDPAKLRVGKTIQIPGAKTGAGTQVAALSKKDAGSRAASESSKGTTSTATPQTSGTAKTWKVGKGENLWRIAENALGDGKRWGEIARLNPKVDPDKLVRGQTRLLPGSTTSGAKKTSTQVASKPTSSKSSGASKSSQAKGAPVLVASAAGSERSARRGGKVK